MSCLFREEGKGQSTPRSGNSSPPSRVQVQVGRRVGGGNVPGGSPEAGGAGEPLVYPSLPQVIMPGYCVQGTVGHKILSGQRKLEMEGRQVVSPHLSLPALWTKRIQEKEWQISHPGCGNFETCL